MTELSIAENIAVTSALIASLLLALLAAGVLKRSEIGAVFRRVAEAPESGFARFHLLAFVEKLERAGSEAEVVRLLFAGWLPREIVEAANRNALH